VLSVFGGKITTYRRLAEDAVNLLAAALGTRTTPWTALAKLPGGDLPEGSLAVFLRTVERRYPWLPAPLRRRYAHAYGTRLERLLGGAAALADLGRELLPQLYERELEYLCREEFARSAQDILWRRSKLGLHLLGVDLSPLERWLEARERAPRPRRASTTGEL
jgi:glycerol-3-phosphate dehydrogenase